MVEFIKEYIPNVYLLKEELLAAIVETLQMVTISAGIAFVVGIILGVLLVVMKKGGIMENSVIYGGIDKLINLIRSVPFIILIAALIPITRMISGTSIGTVGAIFPLVVGITPFFSRQVEAGFSEIDPGLIEAAEVMGFSPLEIIFHVYLKESKAALVRAITITLVNLIGLSAISGVVGAGGIGNFAILRGFQRNRMDIVYVSILLILLMVTIIEVTGKQVIGKIRK